MVKPDALRSGKIFAFPHAIADWLVHDRVWPIMVSLSITNVCNHACPDCNGGKDTGFRHMPWEVIERVLVECTNGGTRAVTFAGGGEPLTHPLAMEALLLARALKMAVGLITNGSMISNNNVANLVTYCDWIRVSLDAGSENQFLARHGVDEFDYVVRALALLGSQNGECRVGATYLLDEPDEPDMDRACTIAKSAGISFIQFKPMDGIVCDAQAIVRRLNELHSTKEFAVLYSDRCADNERDYGVCHAMRFVAEIAADGNVYPCCIYKNRGQRVLGNVASQTLAAVYESDDAKKQYALPVAHCPKHCRNHILNTDLEACRRAYSFAPKHAEFV